MKAFFSTFGCRVNQYETQAIREGLSREGISSSDEAGECQIFVINTCAVTAESERKARQAIRRALRYKKKADVVVCVCGCYAQGAEDEEWMQEVDLLCGNTQKSRIASLLAEYCRTPRQARRPLDLREDISRARPYEEMSICRSQNARAFLKIQDGCNSFCTYCYVPLVRGRVRSRSMEAILSEARRLTENGYREIVLTGIETGSYGEDLSDEENLPRLVESLHGLEGLERIRFGSLKPSVLTEDFVRRMAALEKVMPHFHLSLQSGSDAVLERMGRRYRRRDEEEAASRLQKYFSDLALSADLICGFPGEGESDFDRTLSLVKTLGLVHTHIFPYSPRRGTLAATMTDTVPEEEKRRRAAQLLSVAKESSLAFARARVGREYAVLCERIRNGRMLGYTPNFLYTSTPAPRDCRVGEIYPVVLEEKADFSVETLTVSAKSEK